MDDVISECSDNLDEDFENLLKNVEEDQIEIEKKNEYETDFRIRHKDSYLDDFEALIEENKNTDADFDALLSEEMDDVQCVGKEDKEEAEQPILMQKQNNEDEHKTICNDYVEMDDDTPADCEDKLNEGINENTAEAQNKPEDIARASLEWNEQEQQTATEAHCGEQDKVGIMPAHK